ncbi:MAG: twin-arginine translocation signal domain-containing protein, partial [Deltaproteobacteria bacterium]
MSVVSRRRFLAALGLVAALAPAALRAEPSETLEVLVFPDGHVEVGGRRLDDAGLEAA